ncbi:putative UDP-N-acetylglucosamine [Holospora obtusa F1]|uniref:UDP-N-acetylglucosamine n=1 Tax=Holospora obtusa F1 TaxID=1399147 RepID=W6TDF8_HOLOB|nr:glycosyltransferase [Holospora obtusa]ETZ06786.1 putative UDP-N-acetylglucosamine [Holospora obtusa F1]
MVLLIAGGSGGHVFPAIALAQRLSDHAYSVCLLTDERGKRFIKDYTHIFDHIEVLSNFSFSGRYSRYVKPITMSIQVLVWIWQIRKIFRRHKSIQACFSFGGMMSVVPMLWGRYFYRNANKKEIFFSLHQSDRVLGRANRFLSNWIPVLFTGYPDTFKIPKNVAVFPVGTPVRKEFFEIPEPTLPRKFLGILILGGSQSASFWSTIFLKALEQLSFQQQKKIYVFHQCPEKESFLRTKTLW